MNRLVHPMHQAVVNNNLVYPGNIIRNDIESEKTVIHQRENFSFAGGTIGEQEGDSQDGIYSSFL